MRRAAAPVPAAEPGGNLPPVPVIDATAGGTLAVVDACPDGLRRLVEIGRREYTALGLVLADRWSRRWLARTGNPYLAEIEAVAGRVGTPGAFVLNLSYEWACTAGADPEGTGHGPRLLRTLDWGMAGLGETLVAVRRAGRAGPWIDLTWPGAAGSVTVMAPARFAAAINQPPMRRRGLPLPADWLLNRIGFLNRQALPPMHLLRHVAETAPDFRAALETLATVPLAAPVFFSLAGTRAGEVAVIERTEEAAAVHRGPAVVSNHWLSPAFQRLGSRPRTTTSHDRYAAMAASLAGARELDWVVPPILDPCTRVAVHLEPAAGRLLVQGFADGRPVTAETAIAA